MIFNKAGKQQSLHVQVDFDIKKNQANLSLTSQHLFCCTCPTDNKRTLIHGSVNTGTFTEVMTHGNNLFKKVNKRIYLYGIFILCSLVRGSDIYTISSESSGFLIDYNMYCLKTVPSLYAFTLLKTTRIYLLTVGEISVSAKQQHSIQ